MNAIPEFSMGIRQPRRSVKPIRQAEVSECGLACLGMIANFLGHDLDLPALRRRFGTSSRGMTLRQVMQTADSLGMAGRPLKVGLEGLGKLELPAILHWDLNHFVVLERIKGNKVYIIDPARGAGWHTFEAISAHFTGVALEIRRAPGFAPEAEKRPLKLRQLWSRSRGFARSVGQILLLSLVLQTYALASPYYLQIAVDQVLPSLDSDLLAVLAIGFLLLGIVGAGAALLRSFTLLASGTALSFGITANVARRLLRLPISWFETRSVGDILSRFQSVHPIQQLLTESGPGAIIDGALAILTLTMMMVYSPVLAIIPAVAAITYVALRCATLSAERQAENERIIATGREQGSMIETLRGIVTLRLAGREVMRQAVWQNRLSEALGAKYTHERFRIFQQTGFTLIGTLEHIALVWLAVRLCIHGGFSIGMVIAFLAYRLQFSTATKSLTDAIIDMRLLSLHLDRLSDIALTDEDEGYHEPQQTWATDCQGRIDLRGIVFAYGPHDPRILNGVDLSIVPGDHVAITGPSGGGKTTLTKILLGLVSPQAGEVLIDGVALERYGRRAFRESVGAVLQDDTLFAGTIADNVAGFEEVDHDRLRKALDDAAVLDDVNAMPLKHLTLVGDMGSTLSGGQRQRILLARALYRQPRILVMDEGTAHLDVALEARVNARIGAMGITRIIIAHRKETIAAASRIILIENGKAREIDKGQS